MDIITLIKGYVKDLVSAGRTFFDHPDRFHDFEKTVVDLSHRTAAEYMAMTLGQMDSLIIDSGARKKQFSVMRHDKRTLISTAGDVTFTHTLFTDRKTGTHRYILDELIHLPDHERFTAQAEAKVLSEAEAHSYQHAADSLAIGGQKVSRTAVMHKVHSILQELPEEKEMPENGKKWCKYLYIEADEDHIHAQKDSQGKNGWIGKLVYLFEGKEDVSKGRKILISPHYHGGLYEGSEGNARLWTEVQKYIECHYNTKTLKRVYISGDGGAWIKAGTDYVDRSVFVADRFHLMKYINQAARFTLDECDITKGRFYKYIYKNKLLATKKLLTRIQNHCDGSDKAVEQCRNYLINNWDAIQRSFHDKNVLGCSAEGHVSNVLSDRMSSRPMGWSREGSDNMCKLRCYVKNNGRKKIIDLVQYRREREFLEQKKQREATGTDGMIEMAKARTHFTRSQKEAFSYAEAMHATIGGDTVRKTMAIRERINNI